MKRHNMKVGYARPKKDKSNMLSNLAIVGLMAVVAVLMTAAISVQASNVILKRNYELLEKQYTGLYVQNMQMNNQD